MDTKTVTSNQTQNLPRGNEFAQKIENAVLKSKQSGRPFFVVLLQIENLDTYRKRSPRYVVLNLYKEIYQTIRKAVHPSQFVGSFQNGFGLVFDRVEAGHVDNIAKGLTMLANKVIKEGSYNDLTSRWTEIISQFLLPNKPSVIYPKVGWAIYPRDGEQAGQIVKRALYHLKELNK